MVGEELGWDESVQEIPLYVDVSASGSHAYYVVGVRPGRV